MTSCRICSGTADLSLRATERMFGLGGEFWYDRCGTCGCVQIRDIPAELGAYYPNNYYSLRADRTWWSGLHSLAQRARDALVFSRAWTLGRRIRPLLSPHMLAYREWFAHTATGPASRILDVGSGAGPLLRRLVAQGFEHVLGVDPFVDRDVTYRGKVLVRKGTIDDVAGRFDLIMFHHALEHIADQHATLTRVAALLAPGGHCLIRIPTVSSAAWDEYRDRWVQLDAPRHLTLHSVESLRRLALFAGLELVTVVYDSTGFQFEGSELYRRDRPLTELPKAGYTRAERRGFAARAAALNAAGRGDQAAFYLRAI